MSKKIPKLRDFNYIVLIESIGFFLAALLTGINVDMNAVIAEIMIIIINESIPNTNIVTTKFNALFNTLLNMIVPILDKNTQIIESIIDSEKNILNTSLPLAPIALNIPISLRLFDIETDNFYSTF